MNAGKAHKYRLDYSIYRRNVHLDQVVYGDRQGRIHQVKTSDSHADAGEQIIEADGDGRKTVIKYDNKKKLWSSETRIPNSFLGRFIGTHGSNRKKVEESTNCKITLPGQHSKGPITISSAQSRENVLRCLDQIDLFLFKQRERAPPTHFISLPVQSEELKDKYSEFRELIRNSATVQDELKDDGFNIPYQKMHLTAVCLGLYTDEDIEAAIKAFDEIGSKKVRPLTLCNPLTVNIKGISHFGDEDPSESRVLYGKVTGLGLMEVCEALREGLCATGLTKDDTRPLQLHLTLMNSRFKNVKSFDLRSILSELSEFDFGSAIVDKICLCSMGGVDSRTGSYPIVHSVSLC